MLITNRRFEAAEAAAIGLVTYVVEPDMLLKEGRELIEKLVAGPTLALGRTCALLRAGASSTLDDHLQREAGEIAKAGVGCEAREGFAAFVGKRKPDFQGAANQHRIPEASLDRESVK
jgi:2-(1,2-epoxy-1,2-dihydrophenyl)acetyl-CoA isomerase